MRGGFRNRAHPCVPPPHPGPLFFVSLRHPAALAWRDAPASGCGRNGGAKGPWISDIEERSRTRWCAPRAAGSAVPAPSRSRATASRLVINGRDRSDARGHGAGDPRGDRRFRRDRGRRHRRAGGPGRHGGRRACRARHPHQQQRRPAAQATFREIDRRRLPPGRGDEHGGAGGDDRPGGRRHGRSAASGASSTSPRSR